MQSEVDWRGMEDREYVRAAMKQWARAYKLVGGWIMNPMWTGRNTRIRELTANLVDGVLTNSGATQWTARGLEFNGVAGNSVDWPLATNPLPAATTKGMTISVLMRHHVLAPIVSDGIVFGRWNGNGWMFLERATDSTMRLYLNGINLVAPSRSGRVATWTGRWNGATISLFCDGERVSAPLSAASLTDATVPMSIGRCSANPAYRPDYAIAAVLAHATPLSLCMISQLGKDMLAPFRRPSRRYFDLGSIVPQLIYAMQDEALVGSAL